MHSTKSGQPKPPRNVSNVRGKRYGPTRSRPHPMRSLFGRVNLAGSVLLRQPHHGTKADHHPASDQLDNEQAGRAKADPPCRRHAAAERLARSDEHTSEPQSLMSIQYAVFSLKTKTVTEHPI